MVPNDDDHNVVHFNYYYVHLVCLQHILYIGLLQTYFNETIALNNLTSQVTAMQQELTDLTQSLTSAANRLQNCYKTP